MSGFGERHLFPRVPRKSDSWFIPCSWTDVNDVGRLRLAAGLRFLSSGARPPERTDALMRRAARRRATSQASSRVQVVRSEFIEVTGCFCKQKPRQVGKKGIFLGSRKAGLWFQVFASSGKEPRRIPSEKPQGGIGCLRALRDNVAPEVVTIEGQAQQKALSHKHTIDPFRLVHGVTGITVRLPTPDETHANGDFDQPVNFPKPAAGSAEDFCGRMLMLMLMCL